MQVYLEGYAPLYVYNLKLNLELKSNIITVLVLFMDATPVNAKLCLYDSIELTVDENAATLKGAKVIVRKGWNAVSGKAVADGAVNQDGFFEINLAPGAYTAEYYMDGYVTTRENFLLSDEGGTIRAYTVPEITDGAEKIVLAWDSGQNANLDLDLAAFTPEQARYGNMNSISAKNPADEYGSFLMADSVGSRCEVISISNRLSGVYKIYVNDYTSYLNGLYDSAAMVGCRARVYIFTADGLIAVYYISWDAKGIVWEVCEKRSGYTPRNTVFSSLEEYRLISKEKMGKEDVLEMYRQFMLGNVTAEYEGRQVKYYEFFKDYCERMDNSDGRESPSPGTFALTDFNQDDMPELLFCYCSVYGYSAWDCYMLMPINGVLKMTRGVGGAPMDHPTIYSNGIVGIYHGLSQVPSVAFFNWYDADIEDIRGSAIAWFDGTDEGLYPWEVDDRYNNFVREFCGDEMVLYEITEDSINANLVWD